MILSMPLSKTLDVRCYGQWAEMRCVYAAQPYANSRFDRNNYGVASSVTGRFRGFVEKRGVLNREQSFQRVLNTGRAAQECVSDIAAEAKLQRTQPHCG